LTLQNVSSQIAENCKIDTTNDTMTGIFGGDDVVLSEEARKLLLPEWDNNDWIQKVDLRNADIPCSVKSFRAKARMSFQGEQK
jgi:hypothetical protein